MSANNKDNEKNSFYTDEENIKLSRTREIRSQIIEKIVDKGIPTDNRDIRVLNEIMTSLDDSINKGAEIRVKHASVKSEEETRDLVVQALINARKTMQTRSLDHLDMTGKEIVTPDDIVLGELDNVSRHKLTIEEVEENARLQGDD